MSIGGSKLEMAQPAKGSDPYNYQLAHWDDDIRAQSIAGCIILGIVATFSVVLRLISQRIQKKPFDASDYLIILAWILAMSLVGETIVCQSSSPPVKYL